MTIKYFKSVLLHDSFPWIRQPTATTSLFSTPGNLYCQGIKNNNKHYTDRHVLYHKE